MGKALKKTISFLLVLLLIGGAFIAGDYFKLNVSSLLGLKTRAHTMEPLPDTEPHTAEQVVEVETIVPFDEEGYGAVALEQQKVPYVVEVDFTPVLLGEAQLEKKLIIMSIF